MMIKSSDESVNDFELVLGSGNVYKDFKRVNADLEQLVKLMTTAFKMAMTDLES